MMVDRGIHFDEAVNEFEKKFIKRVLDRVARQSIAGRQGCWGFIAIRSAAKWMYINWTTSDVTSFHC